MNNEDRIDMIQSKLTESKEALLARAFCSIGSNIFFELGKDITLSLPNGKNTTRKEWIIWINESAWRMSQNNRFVLSSSDNHEDIVDFLEDFQSTRIEVAYVSSGFLDLHIEFNNGISLTTFSNTQFEDLWILFSPDGSDYEVNFSKFLEPHFLSNQDKRIKEKFPCEFRKQLFKDKPVTDVLFQEGRQPLFVLHPITIQLKKSDWRLIKNGEYIIGSWDDDYRKLLGKEIVHKRVNAIYYNKSTCDGCIIFEDNLEFHIFANRNDINPWSLFSSQNIELSPLDYENNN